MVRALLDGSKTQTRRAWRDQPPPGVRVGFVPGQSKTPFGQVDDRLWVREAWRADPQYDALPPRDVSRASDIYFEANKSEWLPDDVPGRYRHARFMPRWASRITLEVTDVRVERLQEISDADAIAEGIGLTPSAAGVPMTWPLGMSMPKAMYRSLWESINGAGSWDANPWVFVVAFRKL